MLLSKQLYETRNRLGLVKSGRDRVRLVLLELLESGTKRRSELEEACKLLAGHYDWYSINEVLPMLLKNGDISKVQRGQYALEPEGFETLERLRTKYNIEPLGVDTLLHTPSTHLEKVLAHAWHIEEADKKLLRDIDLYKRIAEERPYTLNELDATTKDIREGLARHLQYIDECGVESAIGVGYQRLNLPKYRQALTLLEDAKTKTDKVIALDAAIHLMHADGSAMNRVYGHNSAGVAAAITKELDRLFEGQRK